MKVDNYVTIEIHGIYQRLNVVDVEVRPDRVADPYVARLALAPRIHTK
jgi:hypothetical protein